VPMPSHRFSFLFMFCGSYSYDGHKVHEVACATTFGIGNYILFLIVLISGCLKVGCTHLHWWLTILMKLEHLGMLL
jgi:hypothetical protein